MHTRSQFHFGVVGDVNRYNLRGGGGGGKGKKKSSVVRGGGGVKREK